MEFRSPETSFLGSHINKIDAKGRVAVPADFRRALDAEPIKGFYCLCSLKPGILDCGGGDFINWYKRQIYSLPAFDDERDALEARILGEMRPLVFDTEGRVVIPEAYRDYASLTDRAFFQGRGDTFVILNPEVAAAERPSTHEAAKSALMRLRELAAANRGGSS